MNTQLQKEIEQVFPFTYSGGGYFRKNGFKKGETAPILHGNQAIEFVYRCMKGESPDIVLANIKQQDVDETPAT